MHKKIHKLFLLLLLIIIVPLVSSCGAQGSKDNSLNGIPFTQQDELVYNDCIYQIYAAADYKYFDLQKPKTAFIYYYQEYEKINSDNWIINYYDIYQLIIINNTIEPDLLKEIYNKVKPIISNIETQVNLTFELYEDETPLEKEFIIDNTRDYQKLYILDMCVPFRVQNMMTYETYIIYIPVYTFLAYQNNESVTFVYDNNHIYSINYYDFIYYDNLLQKDK